jgi:hypothetical protein
VFVQGIFGNDVLNLNRFELETIPSANKTTNMLNRWTGPGTSNTLPIAGSTLRRSVGVTSEIVEDGSFLRLKVVSLAYNMPSAVMDRLKMRSLRIYATAQNLLTFTNYTGYDPEVNSFGTSNLSLGTDYGAYPTARSFIVGVNIGF